MISDTDVKQLFQDARGILTKDISCNQLLNAQLSDLRMSSQFYRGKSPHTWVNQHPSSCKRHTSAFITFNIIPEYCFNCFKIVIEPRTVLELFKLMMVFDQIKLPTDNTRKCTVEIREQTSGDYKGFIYCRELKEGKKLIKILQKIVAREIAKDIPITLKRGCSEFAQVFPEYAQTSHGAKMMRYKEEWRKFEGIIDKKMALTPAPSTSISYNHPSYNLQDVHAMFFWLRYAASIEDTSYLEITGETLQPFPDLKKHK